MRNINPAFAVIAMVMYVVCVGHAIADESAKASPAWLKVEVHSATIVDTVPTYFGVGEDGDDLEKLEINIPGQSEGMNSVIIQHEHTYRAGAVTTRDPREVMCGGCPVVRIPHGKILVVRCDFANISSPTESFRPLDVRLSGSDNELLAAGTGTYPFGKGAATWERLRKEFTWSLSGTPRALTYVFGVPNDAPVYQLTYEGIQIAELHPEK